MRLQSSRNHDQALGKSLAKIDAQAGTEKDTQQERLDSRPAHNKLSVADGFNGKFLSLSFSQPVVELSPV